MRAYVITTGIGFGLIAISHGARAFQEGAHILKHPWWLGATIVSAALAIWAWRLLRRAP